MDTGQIETELNELFTRADIAYLNCKLPIIVSLDDRELIDKWLLKLRKRYLEE